MARVLRIWDGVRVNKFDTSGKSLARIVVEKFSKVLALGGTVPNFSDPYYVTC
jgi:hypothetical protein